MTSDASIVTSHPLSKPCTEPPSPWLINSSFEKKLSIHARVCRLVDNSISSSGGKRVWCMVLNQLFGRLGLKFASVSSILWSAHCRFVRASNVVRFRGMSLSSSFGVSVVTLDMWWKKSLTAVLNSLSACPEENGWIGCGGLGCRAMITELLYVETEMRSRGLSLLDIDGWISCLRMMAWRFSDRFCSFLDSDKETRSWIIFRIFGLRWFTGQNICNFFRTSSKP